MASQTASTTCMIDHGIFAFTIPTAIALVQMRFPDEHLFHKHPVTVTVILCSVSTYSLAFCLELLLLHQHSVSGTNRDDVCPRNWYIAFGLLSLASVLGLLFSPPFSWLLWLLVLLCFLLLTLLAFAPKLAAPAGELFSRFRRGGNRLRRRTSSTYHSQHQYHRLPKQIVSRVRVCRARIVTSAIWSLTDVGIS